MRSGRGSNQLGEDQNVRWVWHGPTQYSMTKSRVSLAQLTSLGRSSVYDTARACMYACVRALRCMHIKCTYICVLCSNLVHVKRPSVYVGGVRVRGKREKIEIEDSGRWLCQGRGYFKAGGGPRDDEKRTSDHLCHGGFWQGEVVVGWRETGVTFAV